MTTRNEIIAAFGAKDGLYVKSLIGKVYDRCVKEAYDQGYAEAVEVSYNQGFKDANRYASKVVIACMCKALRNLYGFGAKRMQTVADEFRNTLLNTIDALEAIEWCEKEFGIVLEDEFLEGDEDD